MSLVLPKVTWTLNCNEAAAGKASLSKKPKNKPKAVLSDYAVLAGTPWQVTGVSAATLPPIDHQKDVAALLFGVNKAFVTAVHLDLVVMALLLVAKQANNIPVTAAEVDEVRCEYEYLLSCSDD